MTTFDSAQQLSDLMAFQCSLVALRGAGVEASEQMLWQTLLAALVEQYGYEMAWYGQCFGEIVRPTAAAPAGALELPAELGFSSPLVAQASLTLPVSVEGCVEGRLVCESLVQTTPERAGHLRILAAETAAMVGERRSRMRAEQEVQAARLEAEAANHAKGMLLANMSHEIRTPMNAVLGFTELLAGTPLSEEQQDYVETIRSSGESLLKLINDILDYSKVTAGKMVLESLPIGLSDAMEKALGLLSVQAAQKGLGLGFRIAPGTPAVILGDAGRLQQILVNLLSNAVKFTPAGEVSLEISGGRIDNDRYTVEFAVRDTGPGIPREIQQRLFTSFQQADASISRRFGGTGLGLAISRSLAEQMGGRMWVESEVGHGSTFRFTILAEAVSAPASRAASPLAAGHSVGPDTAALRVIVAEDNAVNRELALIMLRRLGIRADAAVDGAELLERLKVADYDVVLMDMQMPEVDGLEAARRIRGEWPAHRQPRIVAMTASAFPEDRTLCLEAGMDDYVSKPVRAEELLQALHRAMPELAQRPA
jgi:signal transduction histidine kinase/ActR/RegA family two-component response regulator